MKRNCFILFLFFLVGCNLSDENVDLPGGNTYVDEGKCYKYILVNIKNEKNIESCVSEYRFDDSFITVSQIDEKACNNDLVNDKLFYIIDVKQSILYGPLEKIDFLTRLRDLNVNKKLLIK